MTGVEQGNFDNEEFIEEVDMSAFNAVKISKTKTIRLTDGKKSRGKLNFIGGASVHNIRTAYGRYLQRSKTLPSGSVARCTKRISK